MKAMPQGANPKACQIWVDNPDPESFVEACEASQIKPWAAGQTDLEIYRWLRHDRVLIVRQLNQTKVWSSIGFRNMRMPRTKIVWSDDSGIYIKFSAIAYGVAFPHIFDYRPRPFSRVRVGTSYVCPISKTSWLWIDRRGSTVGPWHFGYVQHCPMWPTVAGPELANQWRSIRSEIRPLHQLLNL